MTRESEGLTQEVVEAASAFVEAAGLKIDEMGPSGVRGHIDLTAAHHTPWGVVHGGVYTTAVESAASLGASLAVRERGQFAVGLNNSTDFLRPMRAGRVDLAAEPVMQGRTQQLWQVVIVRADDRKEVARGNVRLQNVDLPAERTDE